MVVIDNKYILNLINEWLCLYVLDKVKIWTRENFCEGGIKVFNDWGSIFKKLGDG